MAGKLLNIVSKQTQTGKKYFQVNIDGTWGSFWGTLEAQVGDQVEYAATKKGDFTNYQTISKVGGSPASAGGAAPSVDSGQRLRGDDRDRAITRMAVLRTAVQLLTPFPAKAKETPAERVALAVSLAERFRTYVEGDFKASAQEAGPPAAVVPVVDDSVFPKD